MGDNYKKSFLTIAAASAMDDQSGFLGPKETTSVRDLPPIPGLPAGLMVREVSEEAGSGRHAEFREPLYTRGWVLQERLLSPRILSFGSAELRWDCNASTFTETGHSPLEDTQITYRRDFFRIAADNSNSQPAAHKEHEISAIYDWWHQSLVPAYTKLKLTKQDDKLPPLSAIAEEVRLRTGDVYLAGLWKHDLHRGLLWMYIRAECLCFEATLEASLASETSQGLNAPFSLLGPLMDSATWRFFPDVPLEAASFQLNNGEIFTTLQRSNTNKHHLQLPVSGTVWCFLVTSFVSGRLGFMVLGRSSRQHDSFERPGLAKIHHLQFIPGWHEHVLRRELVIL